MKSYSVLSRQAGFTLVELAIALMVIGLLIGGVLKGQELIENARYTAFMRQIKSYDTAAMIFRNTYGAYPGDIKKPGSRVPNCNEAICNIGGNGNGRLAHNDTTPVSIEIYNFFPHMVKAGMLQGPEGGDATAMSNAPGGDNEYSALFLPDIPLDRIYTARPEYVLSSDYPDGRMPGGNFYWLAPSGQVSSKIDQKMDDGLPAKGEVQLRDLSECESPDDPEMYDLARDKCALYIRAGF